MHLTEIFPNNEAFKEVRTYLCPKCWNKVQINLNLRESFDCYVAYLKSTTPNIQLARTRINYDIICSECDGFMIECDDMFANRIIALNKLGFETRYCCEGHYNTTETPFVFNKPLNKYKHWVDLPYVAFSIDITENQMEYIDGLLSFQEYKFIEFEATETQYVLRAQFEFTDKEKEKDVQDRFNSVKESFFRFIDELIELATYYNEEE